MILAALASLPGRPLEQVLRALRPQVDALHVLLSPVYGVVPAYCDELCDVVLMPTIDPGSGGKFAWARTWQGLYFACDDDILYPPDYVARVTEQIGRWDGRAAVSCWGRTYPAQPRDFWDWLGEGSYRPAVPQGRWVNHLGTGALAFDTALNLPDCWPTHNEEEIDFNVWAQHERLPLWLMARPADWPARIPVDPAAPTLFKQAKATAFAARNAGLAEIGRNGGWQVFRCASS